MSDDAPLQHQIAILTQQVQELASQLSVLRGQVASMASPLARQVFLASDSTSAWVEKWVSGTNLVTFPSGRVGDSNHALMNLGSNVAVMQLREGTNVRYVRLPPAGYFPIYVEKTGGSDGTATSAASWTYTLRHYTGAQTLATGAAQVRPRPNGQMTYQSGSNGIGVGFYQGSNVALWDAGEVEATEEECAP